ncbi:MAG: HesB/IscA family protein [Aaplasma endosymbiont of Hyalomma asiaticum]
MDQSSLRDGHYLGDKEPPVIITDAALKRMRELLSAKNGESTAIRVLIKQKGCFGLKYHIEYAYDVRPLEVKIVKVVDGSEVTILIEPKAMMFIRGTTIDYYSDKLSSGFTFKNPNEKGRCGCGESFYV